MFEGYKEVTFMEALNIWDTSDRKVFCYHLQHKKEFDANSFWRHEFKVDGSMILDGKWFIEE